jgi:glycosyltransferase involved in cell wall biosynthesis
MTTLRRTGNKVCHLTSVHAPFDIRIFHKEGKSLAAAGYRTSIIAPHCQSECLNGIHIMALPVPRTRRERIIRVPWQIYRWALREGACIYHFHDPELIPIGILLKLHRKKIIYDVHEDLPRDVLYKDWILPVLRKLIAIGAKFVEAIAASLFDGIVAASPSIAKRFPRKKTVVIQNFPRLDSLSDPGALRYAERSPTCVYLGDISYLRGAREMVQAFWLLPESLGALLTLAGRIEPPKFEPELRDLPGWQRVVALGWLSRSEISKLLGRSRIGLVLLHPTTTFIDSLPIKMFEYMCAGLPVIASNFPLWRKIVGAAGCGLLVDPENPEAIAQAIQWLLEHPQEAEEMGQRGAEAVRTTYNWDREEEKLLDLYRRLANGVNP